MTPRLKMYWSRLQSQLAGFDCRTEATKSECDLTGKRVCFTGEMQSTLDGIPISRDIAEALAMKAGLVIASGVTKKLDILVDRGS